MNPAADMFTVSRVGVVAPLTIYERLGKSPECIDVNSSNLVLDSYPFHRRYWMSLRVSKASLWPSQNPVDMLIQDISGQLNLRLNHL